ncbi:MAG TPA: hypothetical protein P5556_03045 [Candidatus Gastranaerophilales bacterium]|nr:hypothetical protein [Candidatus Gastranaerophilales bacterium]
MANQKITQLTELTAVDKADILYIVDDPSGTPVSKKATAKNITKAGAADGACSAIMDANLTASKNLVSDGSGKITTTDNIFCRWRGASAGDPGSNLAGDLYKDTSDSDKIKIYDGSTYITLN